MFKPKCPCVKDCPDRSIYCRNECKQYQEYHEKYLQYRAALEAKRNEMLDYYDYKAKVLKKPMKNIFRNKQQGRNI